MKIVQPSFEIVPVDFTLSDGNAMLRRIETAGRTCYKSEDRITDDSAPKFVRMVMKRGHESVIEHEKMTARLVCNRGVSHELVRHRLASYSQESTRYCNYGKNAGQISVIEPTGLTSVQRQNWDQAVRTSEQMYLSLIEDGVSPQLARGVLPIDLKTEIVVTANLREWRHIFKLRTAKAAHPHIRNLMCMGLFQFQHVIPVVFDDLGTPGSEERP